MGRSLCYPSKDNKVLSGNNTETSEQSKNYIKQTQARSVVAHAYNFNIL